MMSVYQLPLSHFEPVVTFSGHMNTRYALGGHQKQQYINVGCEVIYGINLKACNIIEVNW
jgi:hypothetical protein